MRNVKGKGGRRYKALVLLSLAGAAHAAPPYYNRWETFTTADGLPGNKVFCVYAGERDVWAGTDRGLARYDGKHWRTFTPDDGLSHRAVMSIAEDHATGDLWIATMGGLSRYSAGRFDSFTQLDSGLANDVVYGVAVQHGTVWAATAAGASRYEIAHNRWTIYNETNTPMHEIWCYSVTGDGAKIYLGVWGGGLLEYDPARNRWKDYTDPDGEMEIDLFRDDGLVHNVVGSVACDEARRIWIGTYFGLSSYDGRKWRNFLDHDSPLVSNFVNTVTAHGTFCWVATDNGLNATDRENWWTYRRDSGTGKGVVEWHARARVDSLAQPAGPNSRARAWHPAERFTTETIFPHNYILGTSFQGDDIWVATEKGVSRGTRARGMAD